MLTNFDFDTLMAEGCIQCESEGLREWWPLLVIATQRDPCTTGCPAFKDGACLAYQKYSRTAICERNDKVAALKVATTPNNGSGEWAGLSMKQIAAKEGISLNEARKRKREGKYD